MSWNVNGLRQKIELMQGIVNEDQVDILCIQEHWLITGVQIPFLHTVGITYEERPITAERDLGRRAKGGLAILTNSKWYSSTQLVESSKHFIHIKVNDIHIFNTYFAPSVSDDVFIEFLDMLESLQHEEVIVVGDMNARLGAVSNDTSYNQRGRRMLAHMCDAQYYLQAPSQGRFTSYSATGNGIPDHVLTMNREITDYTIRNHTPALGDHTPLQFKINEQWLNEQEYQRWNMRRLEDENLRQTYHDTLNNILGTTDQVSEDPEVTWKTILEAINEALEASVGLIKVQPDRKINDILDDEAKVLLDKLKTIGETLITIPGGTAIWRAAQAERKELHQSYMNKIQQLRTEHFSKILGNYSLRQNRDALIKRLSCKHKRQTRSTKSLDPNRMDEHRAHFTTTFGQTPAIQVTDSIRTQTDPTATLPSITPEEVQAATKHLAAGKAGGIDMIPPEAVIYGGEQLWRHLARLFNQCQANNWIPTPWKQALICPVYKKGDSSLASNYRPIALTAVIRRIFERCIINKHLKPIDKYLSNFQAGFRHGRNTQQQVFILHETLLHSKCETALMDMQAAYDTVPRALLWNKLAEQFNIQTPVIGILKTLFDTNESILLIKGKQSEPIPNRRGLLQGSSLSPLLFNVFINDLISRLAALPGTRLFGKRIATLAFADDVALTADTMNQLQEAIRVAETWSINNGMRFNPTKCIYLGHETIPPNIYGQNLTKETSATYLGVQFTVNGIDFTASNAKRAKNANLRTTLLRSSGYNIGGLNLTTCTTVYKTFVRPMLEYCLALVPAKHIQPLQRAQELSLRCMVSSTRNTSRAALHLLTKIPPLMERQLIYQASFFGMLHNSNDGNNPAVEIYWRGLQCNRHKDSTISMFTQNIELRRTMQIRNHFGARLNTTNPTIDPPANISTATRLYAAEKAAQTMIVEDNNIAAVLDETLHSEPRWIFKTTLLPTRTKIDVIRWLAGNICTHMICQTCGEETSRKHGTQCAGVEAEAELIMPSLYNEWKAQDTEDNRKSIIDFILTATKQIKYVEFYKLISRWVAMIQNHCLAMNRNPEEIHPLNTSSLQSWQMKMARIDQGEAETIPQAEPTTPTNPTTTDDQQEATENGNPEVEDLSVRNDSQGVYSPSQPSSSKPKRKHSAKHKTKKRPKSAFQIFRSFFGQTSETESELEAESEFEFDSDGENSMWDPH